MKIAYIGLRALPYAQGGFERATEEIGSRLAQRGHEIIAYVRPKYQTLEDTHYKGITLIKIPTIYSKHLETITYAFFATIDLVIRPKGVDIVHFHGIGTSLFSFFPRIRNMRSVVHHHAQDYRRTKWGVFARIFLKFSELCAVYFPDRTIVVSRCLETYCRERFRKTAQYLPIGVYPGIKKDPNRIKAWGLSTDSYLLFVSRLVPEKGCHYLLEAFKNIMTDKKLAVVGMSSYTDAYAATLRKTEDPRVLFLGHVDEDTLEELYGNAYLFIQPSEIEGLAQSVLTAASFATCVLTSDIPENLEPLGAFGFCFRNKDPKDLQRVIEYLLRNPRIVREQGEKAREHVLKNYNWDKTIDRLEEIYSGLLG